MNNASVQKTLAMENLTFPQSQEINRQVLNGVTPFLLRLKEVGGAQRFTSGPIVAEAVSTALLSLLPKRVSIPHEEVEWWQRYYRDHYQISAEFGELEVPAPVEYSTRLIVMPAAIAVKCNPIVAVYRKRCADKGLTWFQFNNDLDTVVTRHDRSGTYAIRVRDVREAEFGCVEGHNLSSQEVWDRGVFTTTLPERLVDGDTYLLKRDEHLDRNVIAVCAGSRLAGGNVPSVRCDPDDRRVYVSCWGARYARGRLRFRPAIC